MQTRHENLHHSYQGFCTLPFLGSSWDAVSVFIIFKEAQSPSSFPISFSNYVSFTSWLECQIPCTNTCPLAWNTNVASLLFLRMDTLGKKLHSFRSLKRSYQNRIRHARDRLKEGERMKRVSSDYDTDLTFLERGFMEEESWPEAQFQNKVQQGCYTYSSQIHLLEQPHILLELACLSTCIMLSLWLGAALRKYNQWMQWWIP